MNPNRNLLHSDAPAPVEERFVLLLASEESYRLTGVAARLVLVPSSTERKAWDIEAQPMLIARFAAASGKLKLEHRAVTNELPLARIHAERLLATWRSGCDVDVWDETGVCLLQGSPYPIPRGLEHWVLPYQRLSSSGPAL